MPYNQTKDNILWNHQPLLVGRAPNPALTGGSTFVAPVAPERQVPIVDFEYPDGSVRPHLPSLGIRCRHYLVSPLRDRTGPFTEAIYPDTTTRAKMAAIDSWGILVPVLERSVPWLSVVYPDRTVLGPPRPVEGAGFVPPQQPGVPFFAVKAYVPEVVRRLPVATWQSTFVPPDAFDDVLFPQRFMGFPASVRRPTYSTSEQQYTPLLSIATRKTFGVVGVASVRVLPRTHPVATTTLPPKPERVQPYAPTVIPDVVLGRHGARLAFPRFPQFVQAFDPKPERDLVFLPPTYPDTAPTSVLVSRWRDRTWTLDVDPKPEQNNLHFGAYFEAHVRGSFARPYVQLRQQPQATPILDPQPERSRTFYQSVHPNSPLSPFSQKYKFVRDWGFRSTIPPKVEGTTPYVPPTYPARLDRRTFISAEQQAYAPASPATRKAFGVVSVASVRVLPRYQPPARVDQPLPIDRPVAYTFTCQAFPDRVERLRPHPRWMPSITAVPPLADRPRPFAETFAPSWVDRVCVLPSVQPVVTSLYPSIEVPAPYTWAETPVTLNRAAYLTADHPAFVANLRPIVNPPRVTRYLKVSTYANLRTRIDTVISPTSRLLTRG